MKRTGQQVELAGSAPASDSGPGFRNAGAVVPVDGTRCARQRIRTALGMLGVIGLFIWPMLGSAAWLFSDWQPGGAQGGLSALQGWYCVLSIVAASAYYVAVAVSEWSRWLFIVGLAFHAALLMAIVMLASFTGAGFLVAPVLFAGPVLWMVYLVRIRERMITPEQSSPPPVVI